MNNNMNQSRKKSLSVNFVYNAAYNMLNAIFPLITVPYLSRIIMADGLGKVNYAQNIVSWFVLFAALGIPRYGIREIALVKENNKLLNKTFSELFIINFISTVTTSLFYLLVIWYLPYFLSRKNLFLVAGIQLFFNIFNVDWFYQGLEEFTYITKRSFFVKIVSLVAMFVFVQSYEDYIIYALIQSMAIVGNYLFNFLHLRKYVKLDVKKIKFRKHLSPIFVLLSTQLAINIYALLDTTMLGVMTSDVIVGYYTNCHKIISTIAVVTASLGGVMLPKLVRYNDENQINELKNLAQKALNIIIVICIPITIGLILISEDIVNIMFGSDFMPCIVTMQIFSPFILFTTVGNLYGTQLLMTFKKERALFVSVVLGAIVNILLNYMLIPSYLQNGAAFASVITECIVMIIQIVFVSKNIRLKLQKKFVITICFMTGGLVVVVEVIKLIVSNTVMELALSVLCGGMTYLVLGLLTKNTTVIYLKEYLKSKILRQIYRWRLKI